MLIVEPGDPRDPQTTALLQASHTLLTTLFEPEDNYFLSIDALCVPGVHFFVAREGDVLMGTGAVAQKDGYGEVKSMFTSAAARGRGVAAAILRALEDHARSLDLTELRLETAHALDAAVRLYERHGFQRCGLFGDYVPNTTSVFMSKTL